MLDRTVTKFSHIKPDDTQFYMDGLRNFFIYRDLGVAEATAGKVIAQLVRANNAPEKGTDWHRHEADFHIVIMTKGAAQDLCDKLLQYLRTHYVQAGVGHYGVFSGKRWENQVYPTVREVIHAAD